jgi:hypothetical protein
VGKFALINQLISDVDAYDYLIVCDDDVEFPSRFVDRFLSLVKEFGFSISQPARSPHSYTDHLITTQMPALRGRRTRFVEIGPVTCVDRRSYRLILPFDGRSPMGWGLDFVWPVLMERSGFRMGIVDAVPIAHALRKSMTNYSAEPVRKEMEELLKHNASLTPADAFTIIESYI